MNREYIVLLRDANDQSISSRINADTPGLAANLAERSIPNSTADEVILRMRIVGRCCRCRGFVFEGDNPRRVDRKTIRCTGCA